MTEKYSTINPLMTITLNGQKKELTAVFNLKELIGRYSQNTPHVIAEINGTVVKSPQWEETPLREGDTIELVSFIGGGTVSLC